MSCPDPPAGVLWDYNPADQNYSEGDTVTLITDSITNRDLPFDVGTETTYREDINATRGDEYLPCAPAFDGPDEFSSYFANGFPNDSSPGFTIALVGEPYITAESSEGPDSNGSLFLELADTILWANHWGDADGTSYSSGAWIQEPLAELGTILGVVRVDGDALQIKVSLRTKDIEADSTHDLRPEVTDPFTGAYYVVLGTNGLMYRAIAWNRCLSDSEVDDLAEWAACLYGPCDTDVPDEIDPPLRLRQRSDELLGHGPRVERTGNSPTTQQHSIRHSGQTYF